MPARDKIFSMKLLGLAATSRLAERLEEDPEGRLLAGKH